MALTQTEVSSLYVAIFNRASEGAGNKYWQNDQRDMATTADAMLGTDDAKEYFGDTINDNQAFIELIYKNTLNKTIEDDPEGIDYWVKELDGGKSQGEVVVALINALKTYENAEDPKAKEAYDQFMNRVAVSDYTAEHFEGKNLPEIMPDYAIKLGFENGDLGVTADHDTVVKAEETINDYIVATGDVTMLTPDTDIVSGTHFVAPMEYVPDGSDRILTLQDEDQLTGTGDHAILDVTLGNRNSDEGTSATVTPTLTNIKEVNIDWTGNTSTLDLRYADNALSTINVNKVTSDANTLFDTNNNGIADSGEYTGVMVNNISSAVSDLTVARTADPNTDVVFNYTKGVLSGDSDSLNLTLDNVLAGDIVQASTAGTTEGFEELNIDAKNNVYLNSINVNELENVKIIGTDNLEIVSLTPRVDDLNLNRVADDGEPEYNLLGTGGLVANNSAGIRTIDASEFEGDLTLDISSAMGRSVDPDNSGAPFYGEVKGGKGNDTFYTSSAIAGDNLNDNNQHNIIGGGEGENTLVSTVGNIANDADITNIQTLELRDQTYITTQSVDPALGAVDIDAFDDKLTKVFMRDEDAGATTFDLNDVTTALATDGLVLAHGITNAGSSNVDVELTSATGSDDTVTLTVVNDKNQGNTFDYILTVAGKDTDGVGPTTATTASGTTYDGDAVENITIHDQDTESNTVTLTNIYDHTGTITLDGGEAGDTFTVNGTMNAKTIDASGQASDVHIQVGDTLGVYQPIAQDVKLGTGNDILTFAQVDEFGEGDSISDAGGEDTVRALFSKDASLNLTGIETLQVGATANVKLDMANADVTSLVLLSDSATNGDVDLDNSGVPEVNIGTANPIVSTNVITLSNTNLTELNFFADADKCDINNDDDDQNNIDDIANNVQAVDANGNFAFVDSNGTIYYYDGANIVDNANNIVSGNLSTRIDDNGNVCLINDSNLGLLSPADANGNIVGDDNSTNHTFNGVTLDNNKATDLTVNINTSLDYSSNDVATYTTGQISADNVKTLDIQIANENPNGTTVTNIQNIYARDMESLTATATGSLNLNNVSGTDKLNLFDTSAVKGGTNAIINSLGDNAKVILGNGKNTIDIKSSSGTNIEITSGSSNDRIIGSDQRDYITTGAGDDVVLAGEGDNVVKVEAGNDFVKAAQGNDRVDFGTGLGYFIDNEGTNQDVAQANNTVLMQDGVVAVAIDVSGNGLGGTDDVNQLIAVGAGSDLTVSWDGNTLNRNKTFLDGATDSQSNGRFVLDNNDNDYTGTSGNDVYIAIDGTNGATNISGGAGNDALVGGIGANTLNGGAGADKLVLQNITGAADGKVDTVIIADGESTTSAFDTIVGFDATKDQDTLQLATSNIAMDDNGLVNTSYINGAITGATINNGLITFNGGQMVGNQITLQNALDYLSANIKTGETVFFNYDMNGDGAIDGQDASFVFQGGSADTVVMLTHDPLNNVTLTGIANGTDIADNDGLVLLS